ncbi:MAG: hypothetical protein JSV84_12615 [Gemmatimonadota bacterium]|nr:MAG: hypothetical protein JSV84_12615 [Gemmatimonadota bacterium]
MDDGRTGGFIETYVKWVEPWIDGPRSYHEWTAIMMLGTVSSDKIYIVQGDDKIHMNLYTLLIGDSSYMRKGSCIRQSVKLLNEVDPELICPTFSSTESFFGSDLKGLMPLGEFDMFLEHASKDYAKGFKSLITDLYEPLPSGAYKRKTRSENVQVIGHTNISIFGATALSWIRDRIRPNDFMGGFLPRFCPVLETKRDREIIRIRPKADEAMKENLVRFLRELHGELKGEIDTRGYINKYDEWGRNFELEIKDTPNEELLSPYYTRLEGVMHKLTVLNHISNCFNSDSPYYYFPDVKAFSEAKTHVIALSHNVRELLQLLPLSKDRREQERHRIKEYLRKNGITNRSEFLQNAVKCSGKELTWHLERLRRSYSIRYL